MDLLCSEFDLDRNTLEEVKPHDRNSSAELQKRLALQKEKSSSEPSNYEAVLARNRPISPVHQPLIYNCYLMNIVHSVSRTLKNHHSVICSENTNLVNGPNAARIYQEKVQIIPQIRRLICYKRGGKGTAADAIDRAVIKLLKTNDIDRNEQKNPKSNINSSIVPGGLAPMVPQ